MLLVQRRQSAPLGGAERGEHDHVGGGRVGITGRAHEIAAVRRSQRPGIFNLDEAEERPFRYRLTAYLLGLMGTVGSGICPSRWIS